MEQYRDVERFLRKGFKRSGASGWTSDGYLAHRLKVRNVCPEQANAFGRILLSNGVLPSLVSSATYELVLASMANEARERLRQHELNEYMRAIVKKEPWARGLEVGWASFPSGVKTLTYREHNDLRFPEGATYTSNLVPDWWVRNPATGRTLLVFNRMDLCGQLHKYDRLRADGAEVACVVVRQIELEKLSQEDLELTVAMVRRGALFHSGHLEEMLRMVRA